MVLAYNRPYHLERCLVTLLDARKVNRLTIFVGIDGPKNREDQMLTRKSCSVARVLLPGNGTIFRMNENIGCAGHMKLRVDAILKKFEAVIVLEDDLLVAPDFIDWMLAGLARYRFEARVFSLSGYSMPGIVAPRGGYFQRGAECQGWATWKRAWSAYRDSAKDLCDEIAGRGLVRDFNSDGAYDYFGLLQKVANGKSRTWAVNWHASVFCANGLSWFPPVSLVENIGLDGSGAHTRAGDAWLRTPLPRQKVKKEFPASVEETPGIRPQVTKTFLRHAPLRTRIANCWKNIG